MSTAKEDFAKYLSEKFMEYLIEKHPEHADLFKKCKIVMVEDD